LSAKKRKEKALKPKGKYDIDFVSTEKKIQNLQKTITLIKNQIEHGKPPEPFRPTSAVSAILEIHKYDQLVADKRISQGFDKKKGT